MTPKSLLGPSHVWTKVNCEWSKQHKLAMWDTHFGVWTMRISEAVQII
jgi:hypothetical protein